MKILKMAIVTAGISATLLAIFGVNYIFPQLSVSVSAQKRHANDPPILDFDVETKKVRSPEREKTDSAYKKPIPDHFKALDEALVERTFKITEFPGGSEMLPMIQHFWIGLEALPVDDSDLILLGQVRSSSSHITDDRTGIYSEFTVAVHEIFKATKQAPRIGESINVSRFGGVVRFPSGKVQKYSIDRQGIPQIGSFYVLFLRRIDGGFEIVTGYDTSNAQVVPLDGEDNGDPLSDLIFSKYRNSRKSDFIAELRTALSRKREGSK